MTDDGNGMKSYGAGDVTMPTIWRGKDGAAIKSSSPVVHPDDMTEAERKMLTETTRVCGNCKHFAKAEGQRRMQLQRFAERLVQEEGWKLRHLVSPLNELGLCGAHESGTSQESMLTGSMHSAEQCAGYRPALGLVSLSRKSDG